MNLNRLSRLFLLLLFVLLQCVAPLAHAHVNGDSTDRHVHIAVTDASQLNELDHHADAAHLSHAENHSAVVCMPPEYRGSALLIDEPAAASKYGMFVLREHGAVVAVDFYPPPLPLTPYQQPSSQAPPVRYS